MREFKVRLDISFDVEKKITESYTHSDRCNDERWTKHVEREMLTKPRKNAHLLITEVTDSFEYIEHVSETVEIDTEFFEGVTPDFRRDEAKFVLQCKVRVRTSRGLSSIDKAAGDSVDEADDAEQYPAPFVEAYFGALGLTLDAAPHL